MQTVTITSVREHKKGVGKNNRPYTIWAYTASEVVGAFFSFDQMVFGQTYTGTLSTNQYNETTFSKQRGQQQQQGYGNNQQSQQNHQQPSPQPQQQAATPDRQVMAFEARKAALQSAAKWSSAFEDMNTAAQVIEVSRVFETYLRGHTTSTVNNQPQAQPQPTPEPSYQPQQEGTSYQTNDDLPF